MPKPGYRSPALHQPTSRPPLTKCDRVIKGRSPADATPKRFHVSTSINKRVKDLNIIAACRPMQWRLGKASSARAVWISTCINKRFDDGRSVGKVAGPVGCDVQQGASSNHRGRQFRVFLQEAIKAVLI